MRLKWFVLIGMFFFFVFLYETKQFASWTKLSRLPIQLKTKLLRAKQRNQNFFKIMQRGKHKIFSFLTNLMNRYRFDHAVSAEKKPIMLLSSPLPVALLSPGTLLFTQHQVIRDIEQKMFERIKNLLDLSDTGYENILKNVEEIRRNRTEELVSSSGPNFSDTHKTLPEEMRKIFYELCAEYNINPNNIYIKIDNSAQGAFVRSETIEKLKDQVITLTIGLESISHFNLLKISALFAHELAHIIQADDKVASLLFAIVEEYIEINDYSEKTKQIYPEVFAVFTNRVEKIADLLFASRNINHAQAMGIYRNIASDVWKKNILNDIREPLTSKKRYKLGYPLKSEQACFFIKHMEDIWRKHIVKKIEKKIID